MLPSMDPLHATIEEFAADGYTHIEVTSPPMSHDKVETDQLAPAHLDGLSVGASKLLSCELDSGSAATQAPSSPSRRSMAIPSR